MKDFLKRVFAPVAMPAKILGILTLAIGAAKGLTDSYRDTPPFGNKDKEEPAQVSDSETEEVNITAPDITPQPE